MGRNNILFENTVTSDNPFPVKTGIEDTLVLWDTDTDFNKGVYTNTVVSGTDESAKITLAPAEVTFYCDYTSSIDAVYSAGSSSGTATGGASVSGGKLDLTGGSSQYVDYDADLNVDSQQVGTIRFLLTPQWSGNPATVMIFICNCKTIGDNDNLIQIQQQTNGNVRVAIFDSDGNTIFVYDNAWNPTSGNEYEFELNYSLTDGETRLFIDGNQHGTTQTATGTRDSNISLLRVGSNSTGTVPPDFKIDDLVVFDTVQHTANYTPGQPITGANYEPTGTYESNEYNSADNNQLWGEFNFESNVSSGTTLALFARAGNLSGDLGSYTEFETGTDTELTGKYYQW